LTRDLEPLFRKAREAHKSVRESWNEHYPKMGLQYKNTTIYEQHLDNFRSRNRLIDEKIDPVIDDLKHGDRRSLTMALAYLAVPDRYFRSGYKKEVICQTLKHIQLSVDEQSMVRLIWGEVERALSEREKKKFRQLLAVLAGIE
jgi:hypothetical protein